MPVAIIHESTPEHYYTPGMTRFGNQAFRLSVVVALVPIAVAAALAVHHHWVPLGDDAFFAIRARDVFTRDPPLLGTWTSASLTTRTAFNNPGPLLFDLLSLPATISTAGAGIAIGVAIVNSSCVLGIAVFAYRRGGWLLGSAATAVTATLCWTLGSAVLLDPTQPSSLLLPLLCFVMAVWSVSCADVAGLPWAAVLASLLVQSYVTYVYLVAGLAAWAVVSLVLSVRAERRKNSDYRLTQRHQLHKYGVITGVVLAVCWIQPLIEQFTSNGPGNITRLVRAIGDPSLHPIGYGDGTRIVAQVLTQPPWWFRPSFGDFLESGWRTRAPSFTVAAASLVVLIGALGIGAWDARRRRDGIAERAAATAIVAILAGVVTAGRMPHGVFGPTAHVFHWLWPLAAFSSFAIFASFAGRLERAPALKVLVVAFLSAVVLFAALNLPTSDQGAAVAAADDSKIPVVRDLGRQMRRLEGKSPVLIDFRTGGGAFYDPYRTAVLAQLQRRSVAFVTDDQGLLYQLGPARRFTGKNARRRLLIAEGDSTRVTPPGAVRVALHNGLTKAKQRELALLEDEIDHHILEQGLRFNQRGLVALRTGRISDANNVDPATLFSSRALIDMVDRHYLSLSDVWARRYSRYVVLQTRWDNKTVALFTAPLQKADHA
jgi:hypothetical protein